MILHSSDKTKTVKVLNTYFFDDEAHQWVCPFLLSISDPFFVYLKIYTCIHEFAVTISSGYFSGRNLPFNWGSNGLRGKSNKLMLISSLFGINTNIKKLRLFAWRQIFLDSGRALLPYSGQSTGTLRWVQWILKIKRKMQTAENRKDALPQKYTLAHSLFLPLTRPIGCAVPLVPHLRKPTWPATTARRESM